jgi:3-phosphoshikimate 1-carboxyvinyltransferase
MGLLAGQRFDSTLIGDASLMRRPMERVAAPLRSHGRAHRHPGGKPPVRIHGGAALHGIDYALPMASAQVKSAVLLAALYAQGAPASPSRRRRAITPSACCAASACSSSARAREPRRRPALRGCEIEVPGISRRPRSSSWPAAWRRRRRAHDPRRRRQSDPHRLLEMLRLMGADIERAAARRQRPSRSPISTCAPARCAASACRSAGGAGDR